MKNFKKIALVFLGTSVIAKGESFFVQASIEVRSFFDECTEIGVKYA